MYINKHMENSFDIGISEFFKQFIDSGSYQKIMTTISGFYLFIVFLGVIFLFNKERRRVGILILITFVLTFFLNDLVFKKIFQRDRPFVYFGIEPPGFYINGYSFPSGHSITVCGGAFTFFFNYLLIEKRKNKQDLWISLVLFVLSFAVMLSRIALLHHYFTDCLAGCVLGALIAFIVVFIYKIILIQKAKKVLN